MNYSLMLSSFNCQEKDIFDQNVILEFLEILKLQIVDKIISKHDLI